MLRALDAHTVLALRSYVSTVWQVPVGHKVEVISTTIIEIHVTPGSQLLRVYEGARASCGRIMMGERPRKGTAQRRLRDPQSVRSRLLQLDRNEKYTGAAFTTTHANWPENALGAPSTASASVRLTPIISVRPQRLEAFVISNFSLLGVNSSRESR